MTLGDESDAVQSSMMGIKMKEKGGDGMNENQRFRGF